ncbi:glycosyltransferase family 4 protein [Patescibacteria group bacterium]|nr:glycosyltransferase family 4 protein [Patescibacteria group bacterium]
MKIGIDCRLAGSKHAGIGRYIESLILNLLKLPSKNSWVLFFYDENQAKEVLKNHFLDKNFEVIIAPISHYSLKEQIKLPKIFKSANLDLLHVPHFNIPIFYQGKLIVTIHDLLWHEYKGGCATTLSPVKYFLKYFFYKVITRIAVTRAKQIIVPAKTIMDTVTKFYPFTSSKIIVIKEGRKIWNKKITPTKKFKKTLLYVGSLYPHKNIKVVLRSLINLQDYKLLIVGSRKIFRDKVETFIKYEKIEDRVTFLGFLDDENLSKLYTQVTALVQPSFSEGFGLTGVEAMALGTPILASNIPIFQEIYQNIAYYFSPHSESSFSSAIHELELDDKQRVKNGIKLSKTYSWKKMALKTLEVYSVIQ